MVGHLNFSAPEAEAGEISKFKAGLIYIVSSRITPGLQNETQSQK